MTTKKDFSEQDWTRIVRAPFVAGLSISLADPGGPIEMAKETAATLRSATNPPSREELLADVALDIQQMVQQRHNPVKSFKLAKDGTAPGQQILAELAAVHGIVAAQASAEESQGVQRLAAGVGAGLRPTRRRKAASWASVRRW